LVLLRKKKSRAQNLFSSAQLPPQNNNDLLNRRTKNGSNSNTARLMPPALPRPSNSNFALSADAILGLHPTEFDGGGIGSLQGPLDFTLLGWSALDDQMMMGPDHV
jgi:hypothetical protein